MAIKVTPPDVMRCVADGAAIMANSNSLLCFKQLQQIAG